MNWDEQLIEDCREEDGTQHPATDHVLSGAHWMLRQLRTDEAVRRVAEKLHDRMYDTLAPIEYPNGETVSPGVATETRYRRLRNAEQLARDTITALLGED